MTKRGICDAGFGESGCKFAFSCPLYMGRAQYFAKISIKNPPLGSDKEDTV